jgi:hypothetical protein
MKTKAFARSRDERKRRDALRTLENPPPLRANAVQRAFRRTRRITSRRNRAEPQYARAPHPRAATRSTLPIVRLKSPPNRIEVGPDRCGGRPRWKRQAKSLFFDSIGQQETLRPAPPCSVVSVQLRSVCALRAKGSPFAALSRYRVVPIPAAAARVTVGAHRIWSRPSRTGVCWRRPLVIRSASGGSRSRR